MRKENAFPMKAEIMYAKIKPWRLFFVVALPGMVSMFAMSIYGILEGAFIGQTLGESAFAAVNIALPLVMINFSLADLIGVGASVPISIALGKEDYRAANNIFSSSVLLIFLTSILMGAVMFLAAEPLSRLMGANDALLNTAAKYLRTYALCSPLTTVFFAMDNYLRISGYVKTSMLINLGFNGATVLLLAFFLFGLKMDVSGAALANCITMSACSVIAFIPFLRKKTILRFTKPHITPSMLKTITACGSPVFLSNVASRVTAIVMNISLMSLGGKLLGEGGGTTAVAVYAVLMYASDFCWPLLYGISDSLSPAIGFNWGAKSYSRVKKIAQCNFIGTAVVGALSTSFMFFFSDTVASFFVDSADAHLLALSSHAIRLFCLAYIFRWIAVSTQSFLSAIEKPLAATAMSLGVALVFPLLMLLLLRPLGLDGIWLNFAGVNALAALFAVFLLARVAKEIKRREKTV